VSCKIRLEIFEGPLDLLLYLIKKEELDIYDIPIARIVEQYMEYLNLMEMLNLDIAGEFLVMAATLLHIKSKMLLPPEAQEEAEELDPRAELVRRLLEYKAFKDAAESLREFEDRRSRLFGRFGVEPSMEAEDIPFFQATLFDLLGAFSKILKSLPQDNTHEVYKDEFTVAEKVHDIFHRLVKEPVIYFGALFKEARNKVEAITVFLALLELIRLKEVTISQEAHFGEIEICRNVRAPEGGPAWNR
jgi:segregation and condensation protein A